MKTKSRWPAPRCASSVAVSAVLLALLVGCGGGSGGGEAGEGGGVTPNPSTGHVVDVSPESVDAYWGHTSALQAQVKQADGQLLTGAGVTWSSTNEAVATVSPAGVVQHNTPGDAMIAAKFSDATGTALIRTLGFDVQSLRISDQSNCALSQDKKDIWCWGNSHPLFDNRPELQALSYPSPTKVNKGAIPANTTILQVAPGFRFSCALSDAGVYCWGDPDQSEWELRSMGTGLKAPFHLPQKVLAGELPSNAQIASIKVGAGHRACALTASGQLYCWGDSGALMRPENQQQERYGPPWLVNKGAAGASAISDFALGVNRSCIVANGQVFCTANRPSETFKAVDASEAPANVRFTKIKSEKNNGDFMGVLGSDGWLYQKGSGSGRRYGRGSAEFISDENRLLPLFRGQIPADAKIVDFAVGGVAASSCVIADNGKAYCWGSGHHGSLGDGNLDAHESLTPTEVLQGDVPNGVKLIAIECGTYHCTAMGSNGLPYAWGYAENAATGRTTSSAVPRLVSKVDLR
ncbi:Ig-like domain-containing protein [Hydrogenophaga atypica]|uniref:Ig-like domain-containing protein n=1 Tax=Hydrogenophaga atypica TaxID=249409 RepID=A0ABW2QDM1_9BURK